MRKVLSPLFLTNFKMATEIEKINQQLEKIEDDLKITMVAFNAIGLTSEERVALTNKETALIKDRTSLREQKQVHIAGTSAPSGNPINLSQVFIKCLNLWLLCRSLCVVEATPPHTHSNLKVMISFSDNIKMLMILPPSLYTLFRSLA